MNHTEVASLNDRLARAVERLQAGDHGAAESALRECLQADSAHPQALHLMGVLRCLQGDAASGLPWLRRAVALQGRPDFLINLANALIETGQSAESLTYFARALALDPNNALAWCNQGVVLKGLERHAEAAAAFESSLRLDPERVMALNGLNACLTTLGRVADALAVGRRALELKARRSLVASPPGSVALPQGVVPPLQPTAGQAWVVAFSLFGADETYTQGALENVRLARTLLPQWVCRFYCDDTVPAPVLAQLAQAGAQVRMMPAANLFMRLSWRFLVADDPTVGRYLCRDCDSRFSPREVATVDAWIASGQPFHMVRDAPTHIDLVLAGLWGGCAQWLPPLAPLLAGYAAQRDRFADQAFLGDVVWPCMRGRVLMHDSQWGGILGAQPFPAQAPAPSSPEVHVGSGFKYASEEQLLARVSQCQHEGDVAQALVWAQQAVAVRGSVRSRLARAQLLLRAGRYREGFEDFEQRFLALTPGTPRYVEAFKLRDRGLPIWQGEPLQGKRIFVHPEQGHGDFIMCARFIPRLRELGATKVYFCTVANMVRYGQALAAQWAEGMAWGEGGGVAYFPPNGRLQDLDTHVSVMSLMHRLGVATDADIVPPVAPVVGQGELQKWRAQVPQGAVGVAWRGDPQNEADVYRSIPFGDFLNGVVRPLRRAGVAVLCLQKDATREEWQALQREGVNTQAIAVSADWLDTTALLSCLSGVIAVDTGVLHLSGSLALPAVMLDRMAGISDWRWLDGRVDSPWYPTLRIAHQKRLGDWSDAMAQGVTLLFEKMSDAQ